MRFAIAPYGPVYRATRSQFQRLLHEAMASGNFTGNSQFSRGPRG
jgi:hypothetical protein